MRTGDGLLARIQPSTPLTPEQLAGLARLARSCGNGIVEVTARGKLQVRGLDEAGALLLAAGVGELDIAMPEGFPVELPALAGRAHGESVDPRPLAHGIGRAGAHLVPHLAPKVSVTVDGGGPFHLAALHADIGITATPGGEIVLMLAGEAVARIEPERAVAVVVSLLERLAVAGPTARMSGLLAEEARAVLPSMPGVLPLGEAVPMTACDMVGLHELKDGTHALGIGLVFGQAQAMALERLAEAARAADAHHVEPAMGRVLVFTGFTRGGAQALGEAAALQGFIVDRADPRHRMSACAGQPSCASGRIATHRLAETLLKLLPEEGCPGGEIHVSGCTKGCAHPAAASLTIVGLDEGAGIVVEGTPRDAPLAVVPEERLAQTVCAMLGKQKERG